MTPQARDKETAAQKQREKPATPRETAKYRRNEKAGNSAPRSTTNRGKMRPENDAGEDDYGETLPTQQTPQPPNQQRPQGKTDRYSQRGKPQPPTHRGDTNTIPGPEHGIQARG